MTATCGFAMDPNPHTTYHHRRQSIKCAVQAWRMHGRYTHSEKQRLASQHFASRVTPPTLLVTGCTTGDPGCKNRCKNRCYSHGNKWTHFTVLFSKHSRVNSNPCCLHTCSQQHLHDLSRHSFLHGGRQIRGPAAITNMLPVKKDGDCWCIVHKHAAPSMPRHSITANTYLSMDGRDSIGPLIEPSVLR